MIQSGTYLNTIDNSGAKDLSCIKILKGYRQRSAGIGDVIVVSIKDTRKKNKTTSKVRKGDVAKALIVHVCKSTSSKYNEKYRFFENNAVLVSKQNKLVGSRIFGVIPKIVRYSKFSRMVASSLGSLK